jgi:hypothetical protein
MPTQRQIAEQGLRAIREQRLVIDALEAESTLSAPENEARLKDRLAVERRALQDLEARFGHQPKSKLIRALNSER